jgi:hypothetical protein
MKRNEHDLCNVTKNWVDQLKNKLQMATNKNVRKVGYLDVLILTAKKWWGLVPHFKGSGPEAQ